MQDARPVAGCATAKVKRPAIHDRRSRCKALGPCNRDTVSSATWRRLSGTVTRAVFRQQILQLRLPFTDVPLNVT
jgi:hypothetical protein